MRFAYAWTLLLLGACAAADGVTLAPPPAATPTFRLSVHPFSNGLVGMGPGDTFQLVPRILESTGDTLALTGPVSYSSRQPAVVSVDQAGLLTVLATIGASTIHASTLYQGHSLTDTLAITVACTAELTAVVTPVQPVLAIGERFTPTISLSTCGGHIVLTNVITWSAIDSAIVSVNSTTGETVALHAGATIVNAHAAGLQGTVSGILVTVH